MQNFINIFTSVVNSFFGTFILVFPFHGIKCSVIVQRKVYLLIISLSLKTLRMSLLSLLCMIEIPTFALLFLDFEPAFIPTFSMEGT